MRASPRARRSGPVGLGARVLAPAALAGTLTFAPAQASTGALSASAGADAALASLDACVAALFAQEGSLRLDESADLAASCPGLAAAVRAGAGAGGSPRLEWAAAALADDLRVGELLDLAVLAAPPDQGAGLLWTESRTRLAALLEEVLATETEDDWFGWWDRFLAWLRDLVKTQGDADLDWLERLLASIQLSEETINRILMAVLALVVLSFVLLLSSELRAAGYFRGGRRTSVRAGPRPAGAHGPRPALSLSSVRDLARQHQPAALLTLCIEELMARGRLPADRSRTNRELLRALAPDAAAAPFADLVGFAEYASYGGYPVTDPVLERCFAGAGRILQTP